MAKRKLKLSAFGEKTNNVWCYPLHRVCLSDNQLACPHCKSVNMSAPMFDIIQMGLERDDRVITVLECRSCEIWYAMEYNTGDIE